MKQPNLDADLISKKQQQLTELQNELNTRPPSHVVVEENIRRIKERNAQKVVKNPTVVYAGTLNGLPLGKETPKTNLKLIPFSSFILRLLSTIQQF